MGQTNSSPENNPTDPQLPVSGVLPPSTPVHAPDVAENNGGETPTDLGDEMHGLNSRLTEFLHDIGALEAHKSQLEAQLEDERGQQQAVIRNARAQVEKETALLRLNCDQLEKRNRDLAATLKSEQDSRQAFQRAVALKHMQEIEKLKQEMEMNRVAECARIRSEMEAILQRAESRFETELGSTQLKLQQALEECDRLNKQSTSPDTELAAQLARMRRDHALLQQTLSGAEQRFAVATEDLSKQLHAAHEEIQKLQAESIEKDRELQEITNSNAILFKEVTSFRAMIEQEMSRITPSKNNKKRKMTDQATDTQANNHILE